MLERRGIISGYEGSKPRQVLITEADLPRVLAALEGARRDVSDAPVDVELPGRQRRARARRTTWTSLRPAMPEIGASLREARMRARIDITEAEADTKIRGKYLRALENEEWACCPGPTFVKQLPAHLRRLPRARRPLLVEEFKLAPRAPEMQAIRAAERRASSGAAAPRARQAARATAGSRIGLRCSSARRAARRCSPRARGDNNSGPSARHDDDDEAEDQRDDHHDVARADRRRDEPRSRP